MCFGQSGFILAKAGQNGGFGQNSFVLTKAALKCLVWSKWIDSGKSCSKLFFFFAKMALLYQKLLKTVFVGKNGYILAKAIQNYVFLPQWLDFSKSYSKLCVLAKMAFFGKM